MRHFRIITAAMLLFVCHTASAQYDYDYNDYGRSQYQYNS